MSILKQIPLLLVYAVISLGIYYGIKVKILTKYQIKKRYILLALVIVMTVPFFILMLHKNYILPGWVYTLQMILFTVIFLIYLEVLKLEKIKKSRPVVGKPKAKPNRINSQKKVD